LFEIALIISWNHYGFYASSVSCQQLFLESTDTQNFPSQGNFSSHSNVCLDRYTGQNRHQGGTHPNTSTWAILGCCPFRNMNVDINFFVIVRRYTQALRARANYGQSRLNRFLHYIAQGTGFDHPAFTTHRGRLYGQELAPHLRPGEASYLPYLILIFSPSKIELANTQTIFKSTGMNLVGGGLAELDMPSDYLPT